MRYTMTFLESDFERLTAHLGQSGNEEAAYLSARVVATDDETRLLIRAVQLVPPDEIESQTPIGMAILSRSYVPAIKRAKLDSSAFVLVHSHPRGSNEFSAQDDSEESALFALAHFRNEQPAHASLIACEGATRLTGRVWLPDGRAAPIDVVRVIGDHWRFDFRSDDRAPIPAFFDRQVRAFGADIQRLLHRLHVGIVGAGGTGSAVGEQLIRLGVGQLTIVDPDHFDASNVNRVYGSSTFDDGIPKVTVATRQAAHIGLGTQVVPVERNLAFRSTASKLRDCDVIFGCTDDQLGRSILCRIATYYLIPVVDVGVIIDPEGDRIRSVHGRVTLLQPGYSCLYCRERISAARVAAESIAATDPVRAAVLAAEGYIAGVEAPAPAVISFTTAIASAAVAELLDRLIGFKGAEKKSSEFIHRFDADVVSRNSRPAIAGCFCSDRALWGAGDRRPFLGVTWRPEA